MTKLTQIKSNLIKNDILQRSLVPGFIFHFVVRKDLVKINLKYRHIPDNRHMIQPAFFRLVFLLVL